MVQQNVKCVVCGKLFTPKRSTGKYDSAACRQKAKRDNVSLWQRVYNIERMIYEVDRSQSEEVPAAIKKIDIALTYVKETRRESPEDTIKALSEDARKSIMGLVSYAGGSSDYSWRAEKRLVALVIEMLNHCPEKVQKDIYQQLRDIVTL